MPPRIPFSTINSISMSVSNSSLNSSEHTSHSLLLFYATKTQWLSLIRLSMLILVLCKNVLGLIYSFLSMYPEMFQIHLLTAIHLLQGRYRDSSQGPFSPCIPDLPCMFKILITDNLHIKPAIKHIFRW